MNRFWVLWVVLFLPAAVLNGQQNDRKARVSVCDIAKAPYKYDGTVVTIQGLLTTHRHGDVLRDETCQGSFILEQGGKQWAPIIDLRLSSEEERQPYRTLFDPDSIRRLFSLLNPQGERYWTYQARVPAVLMGVPALRLTKRVDLASELSASRNSEC